MDIQTDDTAQSLTPALSHRERGKDSSLIALIPRLDGLGGPTSFNHKLITGLAARGIRTTYDLDDPAVSAVLVNGGTRRLDALWRARRRGLPILQRLDGMNWVQRKRWLGMRHFLRAETNNLLLAVIRRRLAAGIVYQSQFSQAWWERVYGQVDKPTSVVYNAVDLQAYSPAGPRVAEPGPSGRVRLLMVEGHLGGGNDLALDNALGFARALAPDLARPLELCVVGDVPPALRDRARDLPGVTVNWIGVVPRQQIPEIDRSAHLFFAAELHAPCPNSAIEAMACGLPVLAYDTGSMAELVRDGAGQVAPYGSDPWNLEPAQPAPLVRAALDILANLERYRLAARARAEAAFGLDCMLDGYLAALLGGS